MDMPVKIGSFQIKQNVFNLKSTLREDFGLITRVTSLFFGVMSDCFFGLTT